jgi:tRNA(Ile)-lysidine synthase
MPDRIVRVRPLLNLKKAELIAALRAVGATWREDSSNATSAYFRNRMRHKAIPAWLSCAPERDALSGLALARELLDEDAIAVEAWLDEVDALGRGPVLDLTKLDKKPKALWRRALRRWLAAGPYRGDLSRQGFDLLLNSCMTTRFFRQSLGKEGFATLRHGLLKFEKPRKRSARKRIDR